MATVSSSSSPEAERLIRVPLGSLHPHPANPNVMDDSAVDTLTRNIERSRRYPPLIVRAHPELPGAYQVLDGAHRLVVLTRLGHPDALCYFWPCDDATALLLLATLNRLHGEDLPYQRAALLRDLQQLLPPELLASLLPEDAGTLDATLRLLDVDRERLLSDLAAASERQTMAGPRLVSFAVPAESEALVEAAIKEAAGGLEGTNRRGRALVFICSAYLGHGDG